jgi:uncharacterized protein with PIN domain
MHETLEFCADVHLGKLARLLRMLGFDTVYKNNFSKKDLHEIARNEHRCLLSKAAYFTKFHDINFYQVKSSDSYEQLKEIISHFQLLNFNPFVRCLECNEILEKKEKEEVQNLLLPETKKNFSEFWRCPSCKKIYWKGSHFERMMKIFEKLKK